MFYERLFYENSICDGCGESGAKYVTMIEGKTCLIHKYCGGEVREKLFKEKMGDSFYYYKVEQYFKKPNYKTKILISNEVLRRLKEDPFLSEAFLKMIEKEEYKNLLTTSPKIIIIPLRNYITVKGTFYNYFEIKFDYFIEEDLIRFYKEVFICKGDLNGG